MVDLLSGAEVEDIFIDKRKPCSSLEDVFDVSLSISVNKLAERASVAHEVGERRDLCISATGDSTLSEPIAEKTEVGE